MAQQSADSTTSKPAVAYPNQMLGAFAGGGNGYAFGGAEGSATFPLTHSFGFQADAMAGIGDHDGFGSVAGHLFYRDPAKGLLGLYGEESWTQGAPGNGAFRIGAEGEYYFNRFTLSGVAGWRFGRDQWVWDQTSWDQWHKGKDSAPFARGTVSWYVRDNTKLYTGLSYDDVLTGIVGVEHRFEAAHNVSVFAEAQYNKDSRFTALGGVRIHFGGGEARSVDVPSYVWCKDPKAHDVQGNAFRCEVTPDQAGYYAGNSNPEKTLIQRDREDYAPLWLRVPDHRKEIKAPTPATTLAAATTTVAATTTAKPTTTAVVTTTAKPTTTAILTTTASPTTTVPPRTTTPMPTTQPPS